MFLTPSADLAGEHSVSQWVDDLGVFDVDCLYDEPAPVDMVRASVAMPTLSHEGFTAELIEEGMPTSRVVSPSFSAGGLVQRGADTEETRDILTLPVVLREAEEPRALPSSLERNETQDSRDPFLPCRLRMYVFEGVVGCIISTIQCILVSKRYFLMSHIGYLMVPFSLTAIRTSWAIYTLLDYSFSSSYLISINASSEQDSQMMVVQLRMLWQCSVWIFPSMSAVLAVWYLFGASLAVAHVYEPSENDSFTSMFVVTSIVMFLLNAILMSEGFWASRHRRYVSSRRMEDETQTVKVLVTNLPILKYGDLAIENESHMTCLICLEDFQASQNVSKLNCGHIFHEHCSREWLNLHLRCPLRCKISVCSPCSQVSISLSRTGLQALGIPSVASMASI